MFATSNKSDEVMNLQQLIKSDDNVTSNSGSEMNLCFNIKLDANENASIFQLAVIMNWALEKISWSWKVRKVNILSLERSHNIPIALFAGPERLGMGREERLAPGCPALRMLSKARSAVLGIAFLVLGKC